MHLQADDTLGQILDLLLLTLWEKIRGQIYLGDDHFLESVLSGDTSLEVPRVQRHPRIEPVAFFAKSSRSRHDAMALAYLRGGHTMKSIAEYFCVHYATVSRAVAAYERRTMTPEKQTVGKTSNSRDFPSSQAQWMS